MKRKLIGVVCVLPLVLLIAALVYLIGPLKMVTGVVAFAFGWGIAALASKGADYLTKETNT